MAGMKKLLIVVFSYSYCNVRLVMEELCQYVHQQVMMTASTKVASTDKELSQMMKYCSVLTVCI